MSKHGSVRWRSLLRTGLVVPLSCCQAPDKGFDLEENEARQSVGVPGAPEVRPWIVFVEWPCPR